MAHSVNRENNNCRCWNVIQLYYRGQITKEEASNKINDCADRLAVGMLNAGFNTNYSLI